MSINTTIDELVESAVCWISADADHPDTPPEEWQRAIVLIQAAPDLLAVAKEIAEAPCDLLKSERHIRLWAAIKKADPDWLT